MYLSTFVPNAARIFHVQMVGETKVEQFAQKFPQITTDYPIYVSYLGQYYNKDKDGYMDLILNTCHNNRLSTLPSQIGVQKKIN